MKLIISGGGESKHFRQLDKSFISILGPNPNLLFIPLACASDHWDDGLERNAATFSTIHFENIEMCLDLGGLCWQSLNNFDAVYIDGGNTFQLMSKIRQTHTYELLNRFIHHGGVINGDSAGAIVMGSHLKTAHFGDAGDHNHAGLTSYQGLNLLGQWAIHAHYSKSEDAEIEHFVTEYGFPVIALHDTAGAFIDDRSLTVVGNSEVTLFHHDRKEILKPNCRTALF